MQCHRKWIMEARRLVVKEVVSVPRIVSTCCPVFRFDIEKFLSREVLEPPSIPGDETREGSAAALFCPWSLREELLWTLGWVEGVMDLLCTSFASIVDQPGVVHQKVWIPLQGTLLPHRRGNGFENPAQDQKEDVSLFQLLTARVQHEVRSRRLLSLRGYLQRMCHKPGLTTSASAMSSLNPLGTVISLDLEEDPMIAIIFRLMKKLALQGTPQSNGKSPRMLPTEVSSDLSELFGPKTLRTFTAEWKALKRRILLQPAVPPTPPRPPQTTSHSQRLSVAYKPAARNPVMPSPAAMMQLVLEKSQGFAEERQRLMEQYIQQRNDILLFHCSSTNGVVSGGLALNLERKRLLSHFLRAPYVLSVDLEVLETQFSDLTLLNQMTCCEVGSKEELEGDGSHYTTIGGGEQSFEVPLVDGTTNKADDEAALYWVRTLTQLMRGDEPDLVEQGILPHVDPDRPREHQTLEELRGAAPCPPRAIQHTTLASAVESIL
jgi:hypothetical protein